ncbi:MAG: DUF2797 domain-containing protein [Pseudomonadota bacterium]|nr:MAG: DUF2797 domain-containing protein [Pseudomonadota bacterium]
MVTRLETPVAYELPVGEHRITLNAHIGAPVALHHTGAIHCIHCGRATRKSFSQGYCYPCFTSLAQCDSCIVKPEQCHYHEGTCREPAWGEQHCMQPHMVYLANSSGIKVGITRASQVPTRWMDQGASQALAVLEARDRYTSGLIEVIFKQHVADRTDWRRMLKGTPEPANLAEERDTLYDACASELDDLLQQRGADAYRRLPNGVPTTIDYPVQSYPQKVSSLNFDKTAHCTGTLMGIKGQYLILDTGVLNIRKFAGYEVDVTL